MPTWIMVISYSWVSKFLLVLSHILKNTPYIIFIIRGHLPYLPKWLAWASDVGTLLLIGMRITDDVHMQIEWETMLFKMNDFRRFRQTVGSIAGSCLTAATPLLASANQAASLVALDVVDVWFWSLLSVLQLSTSQWQGSITRLVLKCWTFYHNTKTYYPFLPDIFSCICS